MVFSLIWLPDVLKAAGLKVATSDGWQDRGRAEMGDVFGVICHHTAGSKNGNMPSLDLLIEGRPDLAGPLAQLGLGRDGTFYVIAAGRCNHAGAGIWRGIRNGNGNFIGIEAENTGRADDLPWPKVQMDAYRRGVAAILKHIGGTADFCAGHKEYALPSGRKPDPSFDMDQFRAGVAATLNGSAPPPVLIPAHEPPAAAGGPLGKPTLRRGSRGEHVEQLRERLELAGGDAFDAQVEAAVRAFQREHDLVPDGIVGPKTWAVLDGKAIPSAPPVPSPQPPPEPTPMTWNPNNRAHACLWLFEKWHHGHREEPFSLAGEWRTDFLIKAAAGESAELRQKKAETHAELLDDAFTSLFGARYEQGMTAERAIAGMLAVLADAAKRLKDLGPSVDEAYRFIGELE